MSNITHDEDEDIIEHGHTPLYSNNNRREDVFDDTPNEDNDRPYSYDNNPVLEVDGDNRDHGLEDDEGNSPKRSFVKEELRIIPSDIEFPI